jgi:hypothetical protein
MPCQQSQSPDSADDCAINVTVNNAGGMFPEQSSGRSLVLTMPQLYVRHWPVQVASSQAGLNDSISNVVPHLTSAWSLSAERSSTANRLFAAAAAVLAAWPS